MSSLTFQNYQTQRDALIAEDRSQRVDYKDTPSVVELKADEVIRNIRKEEAISVWGAKHDDIEHPFPGMEFLTGK
jgi:adenosine deaminase CECR1